LTCPCGQPARIAGLCVRCIRAVGAAKKPYAAIAVDALEACEWDDLVKEVQRRMGLFEVAGPAAEALERLSYE
jgi:hypothetical protein